ncbi:hypothetical protein PVL29_020930 [Vitis rotundifolia]|uniref:2-phosphoglycerate kinase n=1 Tax=Vitis rotundifolia TaxID=103349 RepID=A0AA39DCC2_VITRO|nr:hypothetical protein PVL29_020930 [Vitis rotundifolia]
MKKDKGVAVPNPNNPEEDISDSSLPPVRFSTRNASSKYDFVKVKVWLGDNADHYYVLSRFLLSRMLTVTKIPNHVAIKIALELKKLLIDNSLLDVFHHQRVPLVILVCGTACVGKSTIATQLAQRLNLPNVLQTDMVYELLRTSTDAPLASTPVWAREFSSSEELITEFCRQCRIVRKGLAGDLKKAMKDGKPIIIEGIHLDPSIYLIDDDSKLSTNLTEKVEEPNSLSVKSDDNTAKVMENNFENACASQSKNSNDASENTKAEDKISADQVDKVSDFLESINLTGHVSENKGEAVKDPETDTNPPAGKEKSVAEPIIVPIVLKMAEFDHKDKDKLISNLKTIQDYLCSFKSQGLTVVNISATTFPQTLDWLHSYLLQCIEQGISSKSSESSRQAET